MILQNRTVAETITVTRGSPPRTPRTSHYEVLRLVRQWLHKNRICLAKKFSTWLYQCQELFSAFNPGRK